MRTNVRSMTKETDESQQDPSVMHWVVGYSSSHMQTGQISVPTLGQVATTVEQDNSEKSEGIDSHKYREILSQRRSYRNILNDLSSDVPGLHKIEVEEAEE